MFRDHGMRSFGTLLCPSVLVDPIMFNRVLLLVTPSLLVLCKLPEGAESFGHHLLGPFGRRCNKPAVHRTMTIGDHKEESEEEKLSRPKGSRFPASAYPLSEDESALDHSWISFIDYPPWDLYSQVTRLVEPRRYARRRQFKRSSRDIPPTVDDVALPKSPYSRFSTALAWNGLPARAVVFALSYLAFPFITSFLDTGWNDVNDTVTSEGLITLVNVFLPGISIVLGTLISLTISILYQRIGSLQEVVSEETALLSLVAQRLLEAFQDDEARLLESAECIADQVRTLVHESRGREIMGIVYSDPYARIDNLLGTSSKDGGGDGAMIRDNVKDLVSLRTRRLSDEALALPSTHFDVLTFLSGMLIVGYCLGTVAVIHNNTVTTQSGPPFIAQVLFALIVTVYVLIYEFAFDLNRPFYGTYQLRRSSAAMHLLQIKMLFGKHPVVKEEICFEEILQDEPGKQQSFLESESYRRHKKRTWYY